MNAKTDQTERTPRKLDLSGMSPKPAKKGPPVSEVRVVAEDQGFSSRENHSVKPTVTIGEGDEPTSIKRRRGPRKKKRDESFNTRLKTETLQDIMDICDENTWGYADFIEAALAVYKKHKPATI